MATVTVSQPSGRKRLRELLDQPKHAVIAGIAYVAFAVLLVLVLDRSSMWYPLANMVAVPVFLLSPLVVVSLNIRKALKIGMLVVMFAVIMPVVGIENPPYLELAVQVSIFAGLALGLNIVVGFAGLLDLGYVAFFAVGAYLWGMATSPSETVFTQNALTVSNWGGSGASGFVQFVQSGAFYMFMFIGIIAAALVGMVLGLPVLRLRGDYLAIVTLGFGEVIRIVARNLDAPLNLTNGAQGLRNIGSPPLPGFYVSFTDSIAGFLGVRLDNPEVIAEQLLFYTIALLLLFVIILVVTRLKDSPIGRAWTAIREDEVAAIAMGVPLVRMKLLAFASGAAFAGAIGTLYAAKQTFIDPQSFILLQSISILAMVIVGGMGNVKGVVLGAMIVTIIDLHTLSNLSLQFNELRNAGIVNIPAALEPARYQPLVFGIILVLMMLFRPAGLLPEKSRKLELQSRDEGEPDPMDKAREMQLTEEALADTSTPRER